MSSRSSYPGSGPTGTTVPRRRTVADFPPILAGRGRGGRRLRRVLRPRRMVASVLALSAVGAAAAAVAPSPGNARAAPVAHATPPSRPGDAQVSAPVRFADAAAARLLRAGDRVDVIATDTADPRVVARCARVERVPQHAASSGSVREGALIVLRLTRETATTLAGAAAKSPLAVALC